MATATILMGKSSWRISEDEDNRLLWKREDPKPAEYSSQLFSSHEWVWIGFEDMSSSSRHSHVLGFDQDGFVKTNIVVPSEEGSYLYAYSYADRARTLAVGSDDGRLSLFEGKITSLGSLTRLKRRARVVTMMKVIFDDLLVLAKLFFNLVDR